MKLINFQSVFDTPTIKMGNMNELGCTPDGRIWEYLQATEIITKYMVVSNPANTTVLTVSSAQNAASQNVYITEAAAGWTVGAYQDHWLLVNAGTGSGQPAKIKDNTATTLELYTDYALGTALAVADSGIAIRHYPDAEKTAASDEDLALKGVAQVTYAADDYGWFLKRGIGGVTVGAGVATINASLTAGDDIEGYALIGTTATGLYDENYVGRVLVANLAEDEACLAEINVL